jgi:hypothetical protein
VGKNLHVLGQLDGVDLEMYKEVVLPRVLEQVSCHRDLWNQQADRLVVTPFTADLGYSHL